jgi:hypothetical protein
MKKFFLSILLLIAGLTISVAQVGINTDGSSPDPSAMVDVKSSEKGFLPPRLSNAQLSAISSPAEGLMVYDTDEKFLIYFEGTNWRKMDGTLFWTCGLSFTINHVAGSVAPVNKTVTYGTVKNIPGETSTCWITRNLGASQQATAVNDVTESSAGWYWQFNRKQGYRHTGATLTPSWTITSINENSDWALSDDPCALELGAGWRIPTYTEWYNVYSTGGWANWDGPWGSGLKMHAAGYLNTSDGSLNGRGSGGYYWSSTQNIVTTGWDLFFYSGYCGMYNNDKAYGFPLRCIRE